MKPNSSAPQTLYLGLDVHKEETVIAILESSRDAEPRHYGSIATTQHALERAMHRIAKNLRSNDLVSVNIPGSTDEAIRDLCRPQPRPRRQPHHRRLSSRAHPQTRASHAPTVG